jgi:hypothetical protein
MTAIKLDLNASVKPEGRFEGDVTAAGPSEYVFSGTLIVRPPLGKADAVFVVRLGHGGNTGAYSYLEYTLNGAGELSFPVSGQGQRKPDENVDFRLGFKEGLNGQFVDENKSTYKLSTDMAEPVMSISSHGQPMESFPIYPKTFE